MYAFSVDWSFCFQNLLSFKAFMENDHSVKHLDPEQTQHFFCLLRKKEMKERKETEVLEGTHFDIKKC